MKKYRKLLTTALCAAALVGASILGTMAYFTDNEAVVNTFTVGNVDITLDEAKVNEDGKPITVGNDNTYTVVGPGDDKEYDAEELSKATRVKDNDYHLIPGHVYTKDPTVHITANSEPSYVRMFVKLYDSEDLDTVFAELNNGKTDDEIITLADVFVGYDSDEWIYKGNIEDTETNTRTYEFWYKDVTTKSTEKQSLEPLFTAIKVPGEMTKEQLAKLYTEDTTDTDFKIEVTAQAIQADGFASAEEAWSKF